jgi:hypothetical protein
MGGETETIMNLATEKLMAVQCGDLLEGRITPARGRRLVRFRNCFCGVQAAKFYDQQFLCQRHFEVDRRRYLQDPAVTAANIKACNARCEKARNERLKAAGLCVTCGKREANPQATRCEVCQAKRRAYRWKSENIIHPWKAWTRQKSA